MALERWIREQDKKGNLAAFLAGKDLLQRFGDVPLSDRADVSSVLKREVKEYKRNPDSPEMAGIFWQAFWNRFGDKVDLAIAVPRCPMTAIEMASGRKIGIAPIYVPESIASHDTRYLLGKMFPRMHGQSVRAEDNEVKNVENHFGWRVFNIGLEPMLLNTTEAEVRDVLEKSLLAEPATLNEYIIAAQAVKLLTGRYLDEDRFYSRLLGSVLSGDSVVSRFTRSGELDVVPWGATKFAPRIGARFSYPLPQK